MTRPTPSSVILLSLLSLVLLATRFNHFGSSVNPPDATLAVLFLAGWYLGTWESLAVLLVLAGLADAASIAGGVSAWCVTPAYWFLIPAYAAPWLAGRFAQRVAAPLVRRTAIAALTLTFAVAVFFAISNVSFYLLSGYFGSMTASVYAQAVIQYFPRYLEVALAYVAIAAAIHFGVRYFRARTKLSRERRPA